MSLVNAFLLIPCRVGRGLFMSSPHKMLILLLVRGNPFQTCYNIKNENNLTTYYKLNCTIKSAKRRLSSIATFPTFSDFHPTSKVKQQTICHTVNFPAPSDFRYTEGNMPHCELKLQRLAISQRRYKPCSIFLFIVRLFHNTPTFGKCHFVLLNEGSLQF